MTFFFDDLVDESIGLLRYCQPQGGYYLCFSGGKDSTVLYHIAKEAGVQFDAHYSMTGLDPPEVVRFIKSHPDIHIEHNKQNIIAASAHHPMPPSRQLRWCCEVLKEYHGKGRVCITGVRAAESKRRLALGALYLKRYPNKKVIFNPLFKWEESDIWEYIESRKIKYCSLYDEPGIDRIGCVCCPLAGGKRQLWEAERWPAFKKIWLAAFARMLKSRKDKTPRMQRHTPWKTPEEVWEWWTSYR